MRNLMYKLKNRFKDRDIPDCEQNPDDINVLALVKEEERYIFLYSDEQKAEVLRRLGQFASNRELSFTWYDAAVLSQKIRQEIHDD